MMNDSDANHAVAGAIAVGECQAVGDADLVAAITADGDEVAAPVTTNLTARMEMTKNQGETTYKKITFNQNNNSVETRQRWHA